MRSGHVGLLRLLGAAFALAACGRGSAGGLAPDFRGTWDVTYDDAITVALRLPGQSAPRSLSLRIAEQGGRFALGDAGAAGFEIDCARPELVCPSEVWPRELSLRRPPGHLDSDGVQLARALAGEGRGRCALQAGSFLTGEVLSSAGANAVRPEAVALTSGRITAIVDAACFAPHGELPEGTKVQLAIGYTAAKR